jgi:hypothetical protein
MEADVFDKSGAFVAILISLGLGADVATAAEGGTQDPPSKPGTLWQICDRVGEPERDRCLLKVPANDSASGWRCEDEMHRARRRCMLDVLEGKPPVAKEN